MSNRRRGFPPQDYGPLFSPEQIAAIRKARQRANGTTPEEPGEPVGDDLSNNANNDC